MGEWWSYRPQDLLLFSERVYWRLFELQNQALWPAQIAALVLGATALFLALRPRPRSGIAIGLVMAAAWVSVAFFFLWQRYAPINWAAPYAIPFFAAEAALLLGLFALRSDGPAPPSGGPRGFLGAALFVYALALHPFVPLLAGRPFAQAEIFGLAPDPTASATLGLLLIAGKDRFFWLALPIPLMWCLASWATLQTIGTLEAWVPLAAAFAAGAGLLLPGRGTES